MNHTQFFTDSLALTLSEALHAAGVRDVPVVGQINTPEPEHMRVEVQVLDTEEIIPGNETYKLEGQVALNLPGARPDEEQEALLDRISAPMRNALLQPWRRRPLRDPRRGTDLQYEAAPFIVLDMIPNLQPPETDTNGYVALLAFRAYVQF